MPEQKHPPARLFISIFIANAAAVGVRFDAARNIATLETPSGTLAFASKPNGPNVAHEIAAMFIAAAEEEEQAR